MHGRIVYVSINNGFKLADSCKVDSYDNMWNNGVGESEYLSSDGSNSDNDYPDLYLRPI